MEIASRGQLRAAFLRWATVTVPFILLLGFTSGRIAPTGSDNAWYTALVKPAATPPNWAFPVAWTTIYILMGLALAMIINARGSRLRTPALVLFALQLVANLAWSPLFFGLNQIFWAFVLIVVMWVLAMATTILFGRIRIVAAWLLVPYLVWISYASVLTYEIDRLNPYADGVAPAASSTQITL